MGLGVLDDHHLEHVPGTALLTDVFGSDHQHRHHGDLDTSALQHDKGRNSDVVLVPQPSNSPNDPLNWPLWKKDFMLFLICIDTAVVGAWGPMISPGFGLMSKQFDMSYNDLNAGLGWGIFTIGISCFFTNSMAVIWGRRPIFLLGNLLLFVSSVWGYFAHSYHSLLASRLIGCIGMSPFEVLVTTTIADIYFVHQRGLRLAMWGLCLSVETAYRRDAFLNTDLGTDDRADELVQEMEHKASEAQVESVGSEAAPLSTEAKNSYWHDLKIFHGRVCDDSFFRVLCRPLMMLVFPQVLFSFFAYGLTTSWLVVVGSVLAQLFTAPPYNFSVSGVGLVAVSPLIGSIIGAFISGPVADWITKFMSRRNNGIYEPEFRLVLIIITLIIGGMSFFGFGISLQAQDPWIGPVVFYGMQYFGVGFMSIAVYGYLTDCHRDKAPEAFAAINLRNIYSFGMNYFISSWISTQGPKEVFCIVGGIHVFICLMAIPMYIFGKRCRSWTSRVELFQKGYRPKDRANETLTSSFSVLLSDKLIAMKSLVYYLLLVAQLIYPISATGGPATFWSDYPTYSCLCETSSWLIAVAQCIGEQCGSAAVTDAAGIASIACVGNGYPLVVPSASLVSIGLAALPQTNTLQAATSTASAGNKATTQIVTVSTTAGNSAQSTTITSKTTPAVVTVSETTQPPNTSAGGNSVTTSSSPSSPVAVPETSSGLSTGAKSGIGIGVALGAVVILLLVTFIVYQRQQNSKLKSAAGTHQASNTRNGIYEMGAEGGAAAGVITDEKKRASELHGIATPVNPMSPVRDAPVVYPGVTNEKGQPLSFEEKQELERRRQAAELSGAGNHTPVASGDGERNELETRRMVYEVA
ncbi:hypothetical protein G7Y89_g8624 [Cudoniella acicularis]|uniref:MFS general substrate transporter n=1 Tax=Cudoniella acicularis TaxID=354080 RepID=A0A8H4RHU1_9HELO|nr:hypothetical protein G7Y89_g8624 [Cudoniella acicularis]